MNKEIRNKNFQQANLEVLISIALTILYFILWYGFAYGMGDKSIDSYTYVFGLPAWFFYSCVIGFIVFSFLVWIIVDRFFVEMPLNNEKDEE